MKCKTDNFVPLVVPGLSSCSGTSSSSASLPQDSSNTYSSPATERSDEPAPGSWRETKTKIRGMAIEIQTTVCEIFLNGWRSSQIISCTRTHFSGLRFGTSYKSGIKIKESSYLYSLSQRPKLRSMFANQNYKCSLQKTHWRSSTSSRKVGRLDNG